MEIERQFPKLIIVGYHHCAFELTDTLIAENVRRSDADIVFVSLNGNEQEQWIANTSASRKKGLFIGVGERFDILAGKMKRVLDQWVKLNLDWLYRMLARPSCIKHAGKGVSIPAKIILGKV
ncbi:WecB/TagA/CpsF family glycosyltransferase [Oceanobacillus arenosus]|uniref:WecB/TagA/CpsF family glycosyltransferase n=1 Tax=Oceanobacillus arenosus TaxID=1229153 RepID=UPI001473CB72|nr:WecB/TagA/CpsF family glycosyltransferase [Oceanobacillus arenosus]